MRLSYAEEKCGCKLYLSCHLPPEQKVGLEGWGKQSRPPQTELFQQDGSMTPVTRGGIHSRVLPDGI